jgi:hypothetical protein
MAAKTQATLKKDLDKVFSIYIRQRDKGVCVTCGTEKGWKYVHAGHYVSRAHMATRWDERNVHAQCPGCNIFKSGNMVEYTFFIKRKYGQPVLNDLYRLKQTIRKWSIPELEERIEYYKSKIKIPN